YLVPSTAECEHPDSGTDAATGVALAERLVTALAEFPGVYAKTVFLITYDENDGFFDHVIPPVPPPDTAGEEYVDGWPIGLAMLGEVVACNTGTSALQLAVYDNRSESNGPWRVDVPPGGTVSDRVYVEADYDVSCYGPNRFLRRFVGDLASGLALASWIEGES